MSFSFEGLKALYTNYCSNPVPSQQVINSIYDFITRENRCKEYFSALLDDRGGLQFQSPPIHGWGFVIIYGFSQICCDKRLVINTINEQDARTIADKLSNWPDDNEIILGQNIGYKVMRTNVRSVPDDVKDPINDEKIVIYHQQSLTGKIFKRIKDICSELAIKELSPQLPFFIQKLEPGIGIGDQDGVNSFSLVRAQLICDALLKDKPVNENDFINKVVQQFTSHKYDPAVPWKNPT